MEEEKTQPKVKLGKWLNFKKWCYKYHREISIVMMIILIIIGIWFNPFDDIRDELKEQMGGGLKSSMRSGLSSQKQVSSLGIEKHDNKNIKLSNISGTEGAKGARQSLKGKAIVGEGAKAIRGAAGEASDYVMGKFRDNASIIYEVIYQIAFVIIILLVVFPAAAFFIIALICFVIFRSKLDYLKSL